MKTDLLWRTLTALAAQIPRMVIGPMVLNVANRHPGVLAAMAAALQEAPPFDPHAISAAQTALR